MVDMQDRSIDTFGWILLPGATILGSGMFYSSWGPPGFEGGLLRVILFAYPAGHPDSVVAHGYRPGDVVGQQFQSNDGTAKYCYTYAASHQAFTLRDWHGLLEGYRRWDRVRAARGLPPLLIR